MELLIALAVFIGGVGGLEATRPKADRARSEAYLHREAGWDWADVRHAFRWQRVTLDDVFDPAGSMTRVRR